MFFSVFSSLIVLALVVICVLAYIVVEDTRKGEELEWHLHFAQFQLRHLERLLNVEGGLQVLEEESHAGIG